MGIRSLASALTEKMGIKPFLVRQYGKLYLSYKSCQAALLSKKDAEFAQKNRLNIMSIEQTIEYILKNKCSVARYGDGEFNLLTDKAIGFQNNDPELVEGLRTVIKNPHSSCFVCIPGLFSYEDEYTDSAIKFWKRILVHKRALWYSYCNREYHYGNADMTRFYITIKDKTRADTIFPMLQKIWEGQDVVIIEGLLSRLGVGTEMFSNTTHIERVLCPPENAYSVYEEIYRYICKNVNKDKLILLAIGPTATVLANQLAADGYWAVDIGNIDKEYEWWQQKVEKRTRNPIKYSGEVAGATVVEDCLDEEYLSQIVAKII